VARLAHGEHIPRRAAAAAHAEHACAEMTLRRPRRATPALRCAARVLRAASAALLLACSAHAAALQPAPPLAPAINWAVSGLGATATASSAGYWVRC
jgi:hypothetical protein